MDAVADASDGGFGGFLPVVDVVRAVVHTGWRGPWSYEVFYEDSMRKEDAGVPRFWAEAGMKCHQRILKELGGGGL